MFKRIAIIGSLITIACGCDQAPPRSGNPQQPGLAILPIEILAKQRTTTAVPGSDNRLFLTIDDITHNQVIASLSADQNKSVLPPVSIEPTDSSEFQFGGTDYRLTLRQLDNALVGEDVATFVVSASSKILNDEAQIEELISSVAALDNATFVRNGVEYSAVDAAQHLRKKWDAARDEIKSAEQFIESVGSKSSTSGEEYSIKMPDGEIIAAGKFLHERLQEIENAPEQ